jgi:hypothetical protein
MPYSLMKCVIWQFFEKSAEKSQVSLKLDKNIGYSYIKTSIHLWQYLAQFFLEWEMFQTKVVQKIKTHILSSITFFFRKSCRLWDNLEKYVVEPDRRDNLARARCMLSTQGYRHKHFVILTAFPLQKWLHQRTSMWRCLHIASRMYAINTARRVTMRYLLSLIWQLTRRNLHRLVECCWPYSSSWLLLCLNLQGVHSVYA